MLAKNLKSLSSSFFSRPALLAMHQYRAASQFISVPSADFDLTKIALNKQNE
jgi:hypothetical protein